MTNTPIPVKALRATCFIALMAWLYLAAGFGASARAAEEGPFDVVVLRDVMVPMRDGVKLAADLYVPAKDGRPVKDKLPAVLMRTPYNKERWNPAVPKFFATHGYLSVCQDCRGRYKSEGEFFPFRDEPQDGYDTIEWLAQHPLCNGRVGMHGVSYMAWVQYQAATQHPPHLATMIPHCGPINAYEYCMHVGGTSLLSSLQWHIDMAMTGKEALRDPAVGKAIGPMRHGEDFLGWAARLPNWKRGATPLKAAPTYEDAIFQVFFENRDYNAFWRQPGFGMSEHLDKFPDVPMLSVVGWYEIYTRSIVDTHEEMVRRGRKNQYLLLGPWTHANTNDHCGDVNFGADASTIPGQGSYQRFQLVWFNRWLRDDLSVRLGKPVKVFVMGGGDGRRGEGGRLNHGGAWDIGDVWPPAGSKPTTYYLHGHQNGGGGELSTQAPNGEHSSSSYASDPRNSVSSDGRCEIDYGPSAGTGFTGMGPRDQIQHKTLPGHGAPGEPYAARKDVLVLQTAALARDVKLAGDLAAHLQISSDAPDTDFYVKLIDVYPASKDYPQGYSLPITDGVLRARYRSGFAKPQPLEPEKIYELKIPIQPAANLFKAGHRIRVDISSSSFPNFDINPNTGTPDDPAQRVAHNVLYHERGHASSITLPICGE